MSRSVDPADRNRTIALISLQGDQFPRSALYLAASKISLAALMTGGSREVMRKCAMISPNAIPDWPLLAQSGHPVIYPCRLSSDFVAEVRWRLPRTMIP